jgi:hypothetical protein
MILPDNPWIVGAVPDSRDDLLAVLEWVGEALGIGTGKVDLEICDDEQLPGAVSHYEVGPPAVIRVSKSHMKSGAVLAVTLAHELADHLLIGGKILEPNSADGEFVTDLTCAMLGMGVVQANTVIQEHFSGDGTYHQWQINRRGYLPAHVLGHALAVWTHACGNGHMDLSGSLRRDAAETYRRSSKFLRNSDDCLADPGTIRNFVTPRARHETRADLRHASAHRRLSALWEVRWWNTAELATLHKEIEALAGDRDAEVRRASLDVLATMEHAGDDFERTIVAALDDRHPTVRCAAASLAGRWTLHSGVVLAPLISMLDAIDREEVIAAAGALRAFGNEARDSLRSLFGVLHRAITNCDDPLVEEVTMAIRTISDEPFAAAARIYGDDSEKLRMACSALRGGLMEIE